MWYRVGKVNNRLYQVKRSKDKHLLLEMIWPALSLLNSNLESAKGAQMYSASQLQ